MKYTPRQQVVPPAASAAPLSSKGRTLRIVSQCRSVADFVDTFRRYTTGRSIFIPMSKPRSAGITRRFRIELDNREQILSGVGTVVESYPDPTSSFGLAGMRIEFGTLDDRGESILAQLGGKHPAECAIAEETITRTTLSVISGRPEEVTIPDALPANSQSSGVLHTTLVEPPRPTDAPARPSVKVSTGKTPPPEIATASPFVTVLDDERGRAPLRAAKLVPNPPKLPLKAFTNAGAAKKKKPAPTKRRPQPAFNDGADWHWSPSPSARRVAVGTGVGDPISRDRGTWPTPEPRPAPDAIADEAPTQLTAEPTPAPVATPAVVVNAAALVVKAVPVPPKPPVSPKPKPPVVAPPPIPATKAEAWALAMPLPVSTDDAEHDTIHDSPPSFTDIRELTDPSVRLPEGCEDVTELVHRKAPEPSFRVTAPIRVSRGFAATLVRTGTLVGVIAVTIGLVVGYLLWGGGV